MRDLRSELQNISDPSHAQFNQNETEYKEHDIQHPNAFLRPTHDPATSRLKLTLDHHIKSSKLKRSSKSTPSVDGTRGNKKPTLSATSKPSQATPTLKYLYESEERKHFATRRIEFHNSPRSRSRKVGLETHHMSIAQLRYARLLVEYLQVIGKAVVPRRVLLTMQHLEEASWRARYRWEMLEVEKEEEEG